MLATGFPSACIFLLSITTCSLPTYCSASKPRQNNPLTLALYGFSSRLEIFSGLDPVEVSQWLSHRNINAVFVGSREQKDLLQALRAANIRIYREITLFAGKTLYEQHPEWRPVTADGEEQKPDGWYYGLCPNKEDLRKEKLKQFERLVTDQYIDGVWLDFIRYPVRWEKKEPDLADNCFCDDCVHLFKDWAAPKFQLPDYADRADLARWILDRHLASWVRFKTDRISSWVHEARILRDNLRPNATLGIFTVPWLPEEFDRAILRIVGQDYRKLAIDVDVFSPMVYHLLCHRDASWPARFTHETKLLTRRPVWPIVQAMDEPSKLSPEELKRVIMEAGRASGSGVIVFTAGHVDREKKWDAVITAFKILAENEQ